MTDQVPPYTGCSAIDPVLCLFVIASGWANKIGGGGCVVGNLKHSKYRRDDQGYDTPRLTTQTLGHRQSLVQQRSLTRACTTASVKHSLTGRTAINHTP